MDSTFSIRLAEEADTPLILRFIRELAEYEHLLHEVVADEDTLRTWIDLTPIADGEHYELTLMGY